MFEPVSLAAEPVEDVLADIRRHDNQHLAENGDGGFDGNAGKKKRGAIPRGKPLEGLAGLANDEAQREEVGVH